MSLKTRLRLNPWKCNPSLKNQPNVTPLTGAAVKQKFQTAFEDNADEFILRDKVEVSDAHYHQ